MPETVAVVESVAKRPARMRKGVASKSIVTAPVEIADEMCRRLVAGETLEAICADEHMPHTVTLWRWRKADPGLDARLATASGLARTPHTRKVPPREQTEETHPEQWTPLGIMLARMRNLWADGTADDEGQREAVSVAKEAAPYIHPRLSAIDARITHRDLRDMGECDLIAELALLRQQAGMLLGQGPGLRLPAVIEQDAVPAIPEPVLDEAIPDLIDGHCQQ
jgi:hypothetical protein